jgi:hypothetical protein
MEGGVDIVRVLDVDPDLGEGLEPRALAVARPRALARRLWLEPGPWQPLADEWDHRGHLGLLIVDGFLTRSMQLGATRPRAPGRARPPLRRRDQPWLEKRLEVLVRERQDQEDGG